MSSREILLRMLDEYLDELERLLERGKDPLEIHHVWYFVAETVRRARRFKREAAAYVLERVKRMRPSPKVTQVYADIVRAAESLLLEVSSAAKRRRG